MTLAQHWIDGQWAASESGAQTESINPATGEVLGSFAAGGEAEAQAAIAAARRTFDQTDWAQRPRLRASILLEMANRLETHKGELAKHLTAENGKLLTDAQHEVFAAVSEARYYAGLARSVFGRVSEIEPGIYAMMSREPMGVAGIIVPWNAPVTLMMRSLAPALAAGCTVVVKAAPQTALINEKVFRILSDIPSLPKGVVNMVVETGDEVSKTLVASEAVDTISYTGSTEVGKKIMAAASGTLKRLNLELGGNAPCLVFEDANLDQTLPALVRGGMVMAGQMCTAASRILVHESRFDDVKAGLKKLLSELVIGPGGDANSQMGPMIDHANRDRIHNLVCDADRWGEVVLRGEPLGGALEKGAFISPSLVVDAKPESPLMCSEIFGPVLTLSRFSDEADAIKKANNSRYGLAASVWTQDLQRGQRVARKLQSGTVWINAHNRLMAEAETGGYKESGQGRLHGLEGLDDFMQTKHISWDTGSDE